MFDEDESYFQLRAEVEFERARQATQPNAVRAHHQLAKAYLEKLAALDVDRKELA